MCFDYLSIPVPVVTVFRIVPLSGRNWKRSNTTEALEMDPYNSKTYFEHKINI